ncbi:MAG: hypothetical protein ACP5I4_05915 [Oceanipulchritudo sp.]
MLNMEERVHYLENVMAELAHEQVRTEIFLKDFGKRMDRHVAEMKADTQRFTERMEITISEMKEDTRRMKEDTRRMKEDTRRMKKAWGDLANKMGTVVEDIVAPNIPRLALEEFDFDEVEDFAVRPRRTSRRGARRQTEFDVVCSGPGKVIFVEVKSTSDLEKIKATAGRMREFFDFFPEYEGKELIGAFASWSIDAKLLSAISEAGLYGIAMGDETMKIVARPGIH